MEGMTVTVESLVNMFPIDHVSQLLGLWDVHLAKGLGGYYLGIDSGSGGGAFWWLVQ